MSRSGSLPKAEDVAHLWEHRATKPAARSELVTAYRPLAERLARRFRGRGEAYDDLVQAASIGLINAVDRFDPEYGVKFTTYATRTIVGELKRHLRDRAWSVRVPRGLQEAALEVGRSKEILSHRLGRSPTVAELAAEMGVTDDEVVEALEAGGAYTAASLDRPLDTGDDGGATVGDRIGVEDETLALADRWPDVAEAVRSLPERERTILYLRFYEGRTQTEIAEHVGISQMHVSRLLRRSLAALRGKVEPDY